MSQKPSFATVSAAPAQLAELRRRVAALERAGCGDAAETRAAALSGMLSFGAPEIDAVLPWRGLAPGALHEISGVARDAAASGFVAALVARLAARAPGAVLWCRRSGAAYESGDLYAPGLAAFGLDPARLILLGAKRSGDVLWAMREGLACSRLLAVVGEVAAAPVGLTASRRLQLAAEKSGVACFLLCRVSDDAAPSTAPSMAPSAALSRWRVRAAPSGPAPDMAALEKAEARHFGPGRPRWHAELSRCRAAAAREWLVEWHHETGNFTVAAPLRHRPAEPAAAVVAR
jgi:protein ImuA